MKDGETVYFRREKPPGEKSAAYHFTEKLEENLGSNIDETVAYSTGDYPLSETVGKLREYSGYNVEELRGADNVLVPFQEWVKFDPMKLDADVYVYVHDIEPLTSEFRTTTQSAADAITDALNGMAARRMARKLNRADQLIASSAYVIRQINQHLNPRNPPMLAYQGVELRTPEPERTDFESRIYDLLYVGSLQPRKNPRFIRRAFELANEQGFRTATVSYQGNDLDAEYSYSDLSAEDMRRLYDGSKYVLFPSHAEGFGRPAVEAKYNGCEVLAKPREQLTEILGKSYVPVGTPEQAVHSMECGERNPVEVPGDYNWVSCAETVADIIRRDPKTV